MTSSSLPLYKARCFWLCVFARSYAVTVLRGYDKVVALAAIAAIKEVHVAVARVRVRHGGGLLLLRRRRVRVSLGGRGEAARVQEPVLMLIKTQKT